MKRIAPALFLLIFMLTALPAQRDGPPRRIENPVTIALEGGGRVEFHSFQARTIGEEFHYSVFLPASYFDSPDRRYPAIYFLPGMFNDRTSWAAPRYGNIPQTLEDLMREGRFPEFVMIHPDGMNSFYTNSLDGARRFEDLIVGELPREVESRFRIAAGRERRVIGGVSMGGYGALKIAFKHPDLYSSAAGISPIVFQGEDPSRQIQNSESRFSQMFVSLVEPVYGFPFDREHWRDNSLLHLAAERDLSDLNVYFAYGTADRYNDAFPMEDGVRELSRTLSSRQIPHTFRVFDNEPHGWELVSSHLEELLEFLTQTF